MKTNINFKIKGTKLPDMEGIEVRCSWWDDDTYEKFRESKKLVSYGYTKHNGIIHILADKPDYKGDNYLMFKESDVIEAAKKQGMIKEEFILPEKWCIERDATNYTVINNFFSKPENNLNQYSFMDKLDTSLQII